MSKKNKPVIWTISHALNWGSKLLKQRHIPSAAHDAYRLLQYCLKTKVDPYLLKPTKRLSARQKAQYRQYILRRAQFEPLAYITHEVIFDHQKLYVSRDTLIPRPETEELVKIITDEIKNHPNLSNLKIVDIGTGSGAIAIALCHYLARIKIIATDISASALKVARLNCRLHHLNSRLTLKKSHLLRIFPKKSLDIIVANLPYVPSSYLSKLTRDITNYEPINAIDGGAVGLRIIEALLKQAQSRLKPEGLIFLEIWSNHPRPLRKLIQKYFPKAQATFKKDLADLNRFAIIKI